MREHLDFYWFSVFLQKEETSFPDLLQSYLETVSLLVTAFAFMCVLLLARREIEML